MTYEISFINSTTPTANYEVQAIAEYEAGAGDGIEKYTAQFESDFGVGEGDDIGGLIVYTKDSAVCAVYDYENFCGWVV